MARLKELYKSKIVPEMKKEFGYENPMAIPRLQKIVVSMGVGRATEEKKYRDQAIEDLTKIVGQKPVICKARKSVAQFKVRKGDKTGLKVTLRGNRMYEFLDRLISLALPRVRDFRGLNSKSFDGRGNYSLGITEQSVFPEIDPSEIEIVQGMNVTISTSAKTDQEAYRMLSLFGMPFSSTAQAS